MAGITIQGSLKVMLLSLLVTLVFGSAVGVIYVKHQTRQHFSELQSLQQRAESLHIEWSQLLLEQGTWASDARVEKIARERLNMQLPQPHEIRVITTQR